ncbi:uncharacterized protein LOC111043592 [Nilaparvata lugens]|uniref:uncharacterized protein LOC111043592 n=1 Tax=Nilaparvata lugens TaxID=108931 RepID=UPI00193DA10A|nr:uncharacterized protein LOC111043592 [Nilaparvata lugens]
MEDCPPKPGVHKREPQYRGRTHKIVELAQLTNVFIPDPAISEESDVEDIGELQNQFQDQDSDNSSVPPSLNSSLQDLLAQLKEEDQQGNDLLSKLNIHDILEEEPFEIVPDNVQASSNSNRNSNFGMEFNKIIGPHDKMSASSSFNIGDNRSITSASTSTSSSLKRKRINGKKAKTSAKKGTKKIKKVRPPDETAPRGIAQLNLVYKPAH